MGDTYEAKQATIEAIVDTFATMLCISGYAIAYAKAIARPLWDSFPRCTRWHAPELFAEVLVFHVIKATGMALDQVAFRKASAVGDMTMSKRSWLLHYARYLPPALRVAGRDPGIEPFLAKLGNDAIAAEAQAIHERHERVFARLRPSMRAGVCVLLACKAMPGLTESAFSILARAGINLTSTINATKRLGLLGERGPLGYCQGRAATATL